jgi:hypothetical protein
VSTNLSGLRAERWGLLLLPATTHFDEEPVFSVGWVREIVTHCFDITEAEVAFAALDTSALPLCELVIGGEAARLRTMPGYIR